MGELEKLLESARHAPNNVRVNDACRLAELVGFERKRQVGSHIRFKHPGIRDNNACAITISARKDGKVPNYQIKQLLGIIEDYELA